jgi:tetratricopeptide (TPR) repeat protein
MFFFFSFRYKPVFFSLLFFCGVVLQTARAGVLDSLPLQPEEKQLNEGIRLFLAEIYPADSVWAMQELGAFTSQAIAQGDERLEAIGNVLQGIFLSYRFPVHAEEALPYFRKALSIAEEQGWDLETAYFMNRLGYTLCSIDNYEEGLPYLLKSDYMMKAIGYENIEGIANSLYRVARVYFDFDNFEKAIEYVTEAFRHVDPESRLNHAMNNLMAISYAEQKNNEKALEYIQEALNESIKHNDSSAMASALTNLGMMYMELKQYERANELLDSAYLLNLRQAEWRHASAAILALAEINVEKGVLDVARQQLDTGYSMMRAYAIDALVGWSTYYRIRSAWYKKQGAFEQASAYLDSMVQTEDSIRALRDLRMLSNLTVQLAAGQYLADIKLLEKEKKLHEVSRNAVVVCSLLVILLLVYFWYNSVKKRKMERLRFEARQQKAKEALNTFGKHVKDKNRLIENLKAQLSKQRNQSSDGLPESNPELIQQFDKFIILTEDDWLEFKKLFDNVYPGFLRELRVRYPELTLSEVRVLALIKLNMSVGEMANMLGILPQSVRKTRQRLMKKLGLEDHRELPAFVDTL